MQQQQWSPVLNPFILNWLDKRAVDTNWEKEVRRAIWYLKENGSSRDKQLALSALSTNSDDKQCEVGRQKRAVIWCDSISMNDCRCVQLQLGRLSFYVVDFGDSSHLNPDMRIALNTGNSTEFNQCALLKLAVVMEWIGRRNPSRAPCRKRVGLVASELRAAELRRGFAPINYKRVERT